MFHSTTFLLSIFYIPSFKVCLAIFSEFFPFSVAGCRGYFTYMLLFAVSRYSFIQSFSESLSGTFPCCYVGRNFLGFFLFSIPFLLIVVYCDQDCMGFPPSFLFFFQIAGLYYITFSFCMHLFIYSQRSHFNSLMFVRNYCYCDCYGVVSHKASQAPRPFLICCASRSEF
jgi:hypothetical protein